VLVMLVRACWNMESTVEDMDLSLRAYLNGWKFKWVLVCSAGL
jgi:cellulose synthase/poly-beta-1,6-N-acetylglucosamine synthase-like glycosyltransferase